MIADPDSRRRIRIAVGLSILAHAALLAMPIADRPQPPPPLSARLQGPLSVQLDAPEAKPQAEPSPPAAQATPPQPPPRLLAAKPRPEPRPEPRIVTPPVVEEPPPTPPAPPPTPMPTFDMAAMIAATRERRRAIDAARNAGARDPTPEEANAANLDRNLQSMGRADGTGGVFQVLRKGVRTAEFSFNGWRGEARRWREVIEVDAGLGGDVELAIVRRMIQLIRTHYTGDFNWESQRLGRVIVLSARPEDNSGLEEFLMREFFGTPVLKPGR